MRAHSDASSASAVFTNVAVTAGGVASSRTGAISCEPSSRVSRRPWPGTAAIASTPTPARMEAGAIAFSNAPVSSPMPPGNATNGLAAPGGDFGTRIFRRPAITLPYFSSSSRKRGKAVRIDNRSGSPPWMPASSGSAR